MAHDEDKRVDKHDCGAHAKRGFSVGRFWIERDLGLSTSTGSRSVKALFAIEQVAVPDRNCSSSS